MIIVDNHTSELFFLQGGIFMFVCLCFFLCRHHHEFHYAFFRTYIKSFNFRYTQPSFNFQDRFRSAHVPFYFIDDLDINPLLFQEICYYEKFRSYGLISLHHAREIFILSVYCCRLKVAGNPYKGYLIEQDPSYDPTVDFEFGYSVKAKSSVFGQSFEKSKMRMGIFDIQNFRLAKTSKKLIHEAKFQHERSSDHRKARFVASDHPQPKVIGHIGSILNISNFKFSHNFEF